MVAKVLSYFSEKGGGVGGHIDGKAFYFLVDGL